MDDCIFILQFIMFAKKKKKSESNLNVRTTFIFGCVQETADCAKSKIGEKKEEVFISLFL